MSSNATQKFLDIFLTILMNCKIILIQWQNLSLQKFNFEYINCHFLHETFSYFQNTTETQFLGIQLYDIYL